MIKSSSDNCSKRSPEFLVIGLCLYIAITFHNNLNEAKIASELITSDQSLNIYSTTLCLISLPARLAKSSMLQYFYVRSPVLVDHAK